MKYSIYDAILNQSNCVYFRVNDNGKFLIACNAFFVTNNNNNNEFISSTSIVYNGSSS